LHEGPDGPLNPTALAGIVRCVLGVIFSRRMNKLPHFVIKLCLAAASVALMAAPSFAEMQTLTENIRFCPSWAEAHERTLASLNHGRPPYPVKWKGCIVLKRGTKVDVIDHDDQWTEIIVKGKHWFADE